LGIYCSHDYAHASKTARTRVLSQMKGMDSTILLICEKLNLRTRALPVYDCLQDYDERYQKDQMSKLLKSSSVAENLFNRSVKRRLPSTEVKLDWIGSGFSEIDEDDFGDYEVSMLYRVQDSGSFEPYRGIQWLNSPKYLEKNIAVMCVLSQFLKLSDE
jgi:hypothetical protein